VTTTPFPGASGICAKTCNAGVLDACPKGHICFTTSTMPGAEGGCVPVSSCDEQMEEINEMQDFLVGRINKTYNWLGPVFKGLLVQVVNSPAPPAPCGGASTAASECPAGEWCLTEPGEFSGTASGYCFQNATSYDVCFSGTEDPCPDMKGVKCLTVPNAPPGASGWCVPDEIAFCQTGTKDPCSKGLTCTTVPPGGSPGSIGICVDDKTCSQYVLLSEYLQYWQFHDAMTTFENDLDSEHQKMVTAMINEAEAS
jgi:hypothetical protein